MCFFTGLRRNQSALMIPEKETQPHAGLAMAVMNGAFSALQANLQVHSGFSGFSIGTEIYV